MAKPKNHVVGFIVIVVVIFLVVQYWDSLTAAIAPGSSTAGTSAVIPPGTVTALPRVLTGATGTPNFNNTGFAGFGAGGPPFNGNLFSGPLGAASGMGLGTFPGGGNLGVTGENDSATSPLAGPVPNGFGNCSTNARDGKLLCGTKPGVI